MTVAELPAAPRTIRANVIDHMTVPSVDIMRDLVFYEKFFGARTTPREPGQPPLRGHPPPFVNLRTERLKAGRYCNCFIMFPGRGELGLFLQPEFPPQPERLLQGPRIGLATSRRSLDEAAEALASEGFRFLGPMAHEPQSPFAESIYFQDPSGNSLEVSTWRDAYETTSASNQDAGLFAISGIAQVALDVLDLDEVENFYTSAVGFAFSHRATAPDGLEKSVLRSRSGQVLTLQQVKAMPTRALWKSSGKCHFAMMIDQDDWPTFHSEMVDRNAEMLPITQNAVAGYGHADDIYTLDPSGNIVEVGVGFLH